MSGEVHKNAVDNDSFALGCSPAGLLGKRSGEWRGVPMVAMDTGTFGVLNCPLFDFTEMSFPMGVVDSWQLYELPLATTQGEGVNNDGEFTAVKEDTKIDDNVQR